MRTPPHLTSATLIVAAGLLLAACGGGGDDAAVKTSKTDAVTTAPTASRLDDSTPGSDDSLAAQPLNVTLNFDRDNDLARSSITVKNADGEDVTKGALTLVGNGASLQQPLERDAAAGTYDVEFTSCPTEGECEKGSYSFTVDPALSDDYIDMRDKQRVTIDMRDLEFVQQDVVVSPGTTVTWINRDAADHFVNTDTHPAHTYHPSQNSRSISTGEQYAVTFTEPGVYPYHCSAHTDMTTTLIVA